MELTPNKAISISLFRISDGHETIEGANKKAIDLMVDCPKDYVFTKCVLVVKQSEDSQQVFDLSSALFDEESRSDHWNIVIPLVYLGIEGNAIYEITMHADELAKDEEGNITGIQHGEGLNASMLTSDIEGSFNCMMSHILNSDKCGALSDDVIRNYLILFAHQNAIRENNLELAWEYFKLLDNCYNKCNTSEHFPGHTCNCGR